MQFLGRLAKFWLLLAFVGSSGYFGYFNRDRIVVNAPPWMDQVAVPAYSAYMSMFLLGAFVTCVYLGMDSFRKSMEIRRLSRRVRELEPTRTSRQPAESRAPAINPAAEDSGIRSLS